MHLKGTIVSLKKLIDKHRYLYSIVFFFNLSSLWMILQFEDRKSCKWKNKTRHDLQIKQEYQREFKVFLPWLKRRQKALCWSCLCWCSVSQALLGFLHQEPLEGNMKLKYTNVSKCGKGNLSISHMDVFWFHVNLLIFSLTRNFRGWTCKCRRSWLKWKITASMAVV